MVCCGPATKWRLVPMIAGTDSSTNPEFRKKWVLTTWKVKGKFPKCGNIPLMQHLTNAGAVFFWAVLQLSLLLSENVEFKG